MLALETRMEPFEPATATEADWQAFHTFKSVLSREQQPDEPPPSLDHIRKQLQNFPTFAQLWIWVCRRPGDGGILGCGSVAVLRTPENAHLAQFDLAVLPDQRRRGYGTQLLQRIADQATAEGRRLLMTEAWAHVSDGPAFLQAMGARLGLEGHENRLDLKALDRALVARWLEAGPSRAPGFDLGFWRGQYPEAELPAIAELLRVNNDEPHGDIEVEDFVWTPAQIREQEAQRQARGIERWTFYARDRESGMLAGYSEVYWDPERPESVQQGFTGVVPGFRGHGLGRWLKAAMLDKVLRERPLVSRVETRNADSNGAMLKINQELGFRPHLAASLWQVPLEQVQQYLATRAGR